MNWNRNYSILWSESRRTWVVADERSHARGKSSGRGVLSRIMRGLRGTILALFLPTAVVAAPQGGAVTAGSGAISTSGNITTIQQKSQHLSLSWKHFNVAPSETVNFKQPNTSAIAVNRIQDVNGSRIMGHLNANGQVYLLNPNGILFGKSAQVNVGGLVASTLNISDADIGKGLQTFAGNGSGAIVNNGAIHAADGGYVALLGNHVSNNGIITAKLGSVAMGGGNQVTLTFNGNNLLKIQVDKSVLDSLVANHGLIQADGGLVAMSAGARDALLASVVNNDGVIQAQTVQQKNGKIVLLGGMTAGTTQVAGTLDASAPDAGDGGFIETSAAHVKVADGAKITTKATNGNSGTWLIDPQDYTIAASGGDITGATLGTNLAAGNVTILSSSGATAGSGNINVNDTINWSANTLTLNAGNDINFNTVVNATGTAGLALVYAQTTTTGDYFVHAPVNLASTGSFSTQKGTAAAKNYIIITALGSATSIGTLQSIRGDLIFGKPYVLGANIDATATQTWNGGAGFTPIGGEDPAVTAPFVVTFDGLGHTISNLVIHRNIASGFNEGLFGSTIGATIKNIGLLNVDIQGLNDTGGLVANLDNGTVSNAYVTGTVKGNQFGTGGLVGHMTNSSSISNSYSTATVIAIDDVGGLVGIGQGSTISNSYATGLVTTLTGIGGVNRGGLAGSFTGTITNSYATGAVLGGGLNHGGLVGNGNNATTITNSFWDTQTTGMTTGVGVFGSGGTGLTTAQMKNTKNFFDAGWDFNTIWGRDTNNVQNNGYMDLRALNSFSFNTVLSATVANQTKVYDGTDAVNATFSKANIVNAVAFTGNKNVGSYAFTPTASDYGFTYAAGFNGGNTEVVMENSGSATITPKALTLPNITTSNKVYDATTNATVSGTNTLSGVIAGDTVTVSGTATGTFVDKNVGTGKTVNIGGLTLGGAAAGNYSIAPTTADITPATISAVTGITAANKVYDATANAILNTAGAGFTGILGSDVLNVATATGSFADKNVGNAKPVTISGISLGGTDAGNYTLTSNTAATTANITPATISAVTGITASSKVYDGNTDATLLTNSAGFTGLLAGDALNVATATGLFADKNVALNKTVNISGLTLGGADAGNYTLASTTATTTANLVAKALTVGGISVANKVYDATTNATVLGAVTLGGVVTSDVVSANGSATGTFLDKNVGTGKSVIMNGSGITLSGRDAGNYKLSSLNSLTANITPASLTVSGLTASNKVYDATVNATLTGTAALSGVLGTDVVNLATPTGAFADKNVGNGKTVTLTGATISGTDAANYTLATPAPLTANITPASISAVTGIRALNKVYDGNANASLNTAGASFIGSLGSDVLNVATATGAFVDKNVGNGKTVNISGITLGGADAGNYTLTSTTATAFAGANITPASLSVTGLTASNKVYDATVNATLTGTAALSGVLGTDRVTVGGTAIANFVDKNVGNGKAVSVSGNTISGIDAGNYALNQQAGLTANITPASLTYTAIPTSIIQGKPLPLFVGTLSGFSGSDNLINATTGTLTWSSTVNNSNTLGHFAINGGGLTAANYVLTQATGNATALTIRPAQASVHVANVLTHIHHIDNNTNTSDNNSNAFVYTNTAANTQYGTVKVTIVGSGIRAPKQLDE